MSEVVSVPEVPQRRVSSREVVFAEIARLGLEPNILELEEKG